MAFENGVVSSESVTEGHPDKVCDIISDTVLDAALAQDPNSRVACETAAKGNGVILLGEITSDSWLGGDTPDREERLKTLAQNALLQIGYNQREFGTNGHTAEVINLLTGQSPDISQGVTAGAGLHAEQGAGDQGMMFGFATNETPQLMPLPIVLAHQLTRRLAEVRRQGVIRYLGPDGKSQVSVAYRNGKPLGLSSVVISTQHLDGVDHARIKDDILEHVIMDVCQNWVHEGTVFHVNPTGNFVLGGPYADAGLTGRKIIVDTYGGIGRHGGGAFSGKDPSKVDRSAAYAARFIAKNIVAAGLADKAEVQLAYAIGVADPVSVAVDTFGTEHVSPSQIEEIARTRFPVKPADIEAAFNLREPHKNGWSYKQTAAYGHFGRDDVDFPWEDTSIGDSIRQEREAHQPTLL